jgi:7-keto-8-aminopelargonate synthetase-like enzyme
MNQQVDHSQILELGLFDFRDPSGSSFVDRTLPFESWVDAANKEGYLQFCRYHDTAPAIRSVVFGWGGQRYEGLNFASQDYLGLSKHSAVIDAAINACKLYGTHSAGSEPMGGGLGEAKQLERELASFVEHDNVVLFPTGWAAGYGGIKAIVRPYDYIVLDILSHDCLQHGAKASTSNVSYFAHNDLDSLTKKLEKIRGNNPDVAILVVTESLFSMDSDHADLRKFVQICKQFNAYSLVDIAHDLGSVGSDGKGVLSEYGVLADIDFLVGSFSKTFACIGGFFASHSKGVSYYVRGYSGSYTFSNYLIPFQVAAIRAALSIVASPEGALLRQQTSANSELLRNRLQKNGLEVYGGVSPMILPAIGEERIARLAYKDCLENGLIINNIEFPACRRGAARFRLQVTPNHTIEDIETAADILTSALEKAHSVNV